VGLVLGSGRADENAIGLTSEILRFAQDDNVFTGPGRFEKDFA
jgi:hypothetical protein